MKIWLNLLKDPINPNLHAVSSKTSPILHLTNPDAWLFFKSLEIATN